MTTPRKCRVPAALPALFLTLGLLACCGFHGNALAGHDNTRSGTRIIAAVPPDFPPTYSRDPETGKAVGFAIDVMDEVARRAGLEVEYVFGKPWDEILEMVADGKADLVPNLTIDDTRRKRFAFTRPVETLPISYIVRQGEKDTVLAPGMKVGVMLTSVGHTYLASRKDITLVTETGLQHLLFDLLSGRVDMLLTATPNLRKMASDAGVEDRIRVVEPPVIEGLRGMALRPADTELRDRLNRAIDELQRSPAYGKIYIKWWGKPKPFWTTGRMLSLTGILIALVVGVMGTWRVRSMHRLNAELQDALATTERERKKSEAVLESVGDGITIQGRDFRILYQNRRHIQIIGRHVGELCHQAYEGNSVICEDCPLERTFRDGESAMETRTVEMPDGTHHFEISTSAIRDERGEIVAGIECVRDITERIRDEEARVRDLVFTDSILKSSPMGIRVFDGESGRCIRANQAVAEISGGTIDALLGQNFREFASWRNSALLEAGEAVLADGVSRQVHAEIHTDFGRHLFVSVLLSRFETGESRRNLLAISRDVTEEKRLETENLRIEQQMLHVQKLESLGVLAGGIAHDFNNIIAAILGNADLAMLRLSPESPARDNVARIEQAARRAADLARQMLAYSGKGRFVIEPIDCNALITEMEHMLGVSISKKAVMRFDLAHGLPPFEGDATQIRQVIMNLVINASEAIGDRSGVIAVTTGAMECDRAYLSRVWMTDALPEGLYVYFEVADTGCGMDRETIEKIFDPFFSTKFTGRGLGMAAVLGIIRGHKGAINVYSEPGKGSNFKILLPAIRDAARSVDPKSGNGGIPTAGSGTVLLVDDEETLRALGSDMLRTLGYDVLAAVDGREAVELFRERHAEIACVLLDLTMPRMGGEQCFRELRRIRPDVRIVMTSGYNEQEVTEKFVGKGLAGFIQKPFNVKELGQALSEAIGKAAGRDA